MFVGHYNVSPRGFSLIVLLQKSFFLKSFEHSKIFPARNLSDIFLSLRDAFKLRKTVDYL